MKYNIIIISLKQQFIYPPQQFDAGYKHKELKPYQPYL